MTTTMTGTHEEWLAARLELLEAEKELTRRGDELARKRQALPWVPVEKDYRFDTDAGSASLADLFRGRSQLLVYHFMFGPDYAAGCPSCSASRTILRNTRPRPAPNSSTADCATSSTWNLVWSASRCRNVKRCCARRRISSGRLLS